MDVALEPLGDDRVRRRGASRHTSAHVGAWHVPAEQLIDQKPDCLARACRHAGRATLSCAFAFLALALGPRLGFALLSVSFMPIRAGLDCHDSLAAWIRIYRVQQMQKEDV